MSSAVSKNIAEVQSDMGASCAAWGRDAADVTLIAVSKKQPEDRIDAALAAGHRVYGENRVQEAQERWSTRRASYPDLNLHLIGPLQTNKAKDAVALFDCIHTLDREKLARKLADEMSTQERPLPCFIQVNTGDEAQKSGISTAELPEFLAFCRNDCALTILGLMGIPPIDEPPALHFALLNTLNSKHGFSHLSMGMSSDFDKALNLGATHIRVGSRIFGSRS